MSELSKSPSSIDDSMEWLRNLFRHMREHVLEVPVKIKQYDPNCESCQLELKKIRKQSDNSPEIELDGRPLASLSFTTLLCHLQMHDECAQYYGMKNERIEFRCICSCHNRPVKKRARKRISRSATR